MGVLRLSRQRGSAYNTTHQHLPFEVHLKSVASEPEACFCRLLLTTVLCALSNLLTSHYALRLHLLCVCFWFTTAGQSCEQPCPESILGADQGGGEQGGANLQHRVLKLGGEHRSRASIFGRRCGSGYRRRRCR